MGRKRIMHGRKHPDADKLNDIMERHDLTEADVARELGFSRRMVRYWRNGSFRVPHVAWIALAAVTGTRLPKPPPLTKTDALQDEARSTA